MKGDKKKMRLISTTNKDIKVNELDMWKFTQTDAKKPNYPEMARDFLKSKYNKNFVFGIENLKQYGVYKILGWIIDFRPILKKFIVKQDNYLYECYAFNKTDLRNSIFGRIEYIKEI